jgi:hypothetical protein
MADYINAKYTILCNNTSDINEHLPTLFKYARECESVFETGVRGCISSWALTKGLLENGKENKSLFMNDIEQCDIRDLLTATKNLPIKMEYKWVNNLQLDLPNNFDMTFIDTWHIYGQLKRELNKFSKLTNKYIIMHDTTVDEIYGETIRCGWNAHQQSIQSGFPVEEITCGLQKAIDEFLETNKDWKLEFRYTNNNGLTILKKVT